jgi:hypothetical protein
MKIIYSIALFFACFLNLNAQDISEPSPEFFATGRFRFSKGQEAITQPPLTKITIESSSNNSTFEPISSITYAYVNCTQQRRSILTNRNLNLDSFVIVNGLITKHLRMNRTKLTAPFTIYSYDDYYYSNNRTKPDSIIKYPLVMNRKSIRTYVYDVTNRTTTETFIEDSLGRRKNLERYIYQFNVDGNLIKTSYDIFKANSWFNNHQEFNSWLACKLIVNKFLYLETDTSTTFDTSFVTPKYAGLSNKVDTFTQTYRNRATGKIEVLPEFFRYINVSQNAKGYPTKILLQNVNTLIPFLYELLDERTYIYYPGDTLVHHRVSAPSSGSYIRIAYEYCGIPTLTPTAELQTLDFKIYPNPTNQVLNIEIPENTEGVSIEIINAMGIVMSKTIQLNVDVSTLPTGIYFVQIKTKDRVGVKRFVVNR